MDDGNRSHDVRPQAFSIGPWLATMVGFGLRRLAFGLAIRPNRILRSIHSYAWRKSKIHVCFDGEGKELGALVIDGKQVTGTLQIPENLLRNGDVDVKVTLGEKGPERPCLVDSSVRLLECEPGDAGFVYTIETYGMNRMVFRSLGKGEAVVLDAKDKEVETSFRKQHGHGWLEFEGSGEMTVRVKKSA
ncbi:MAG: hypothetical protein ACOC2L_00245 [Candidatus Sumerlaeota bacterium]